MILVSLVSLDPREQNLPGCSAEIWCTFSQRRFQDGCHGEICISLKYGYSHIYSGRFALIVARYDQLEQLYIDTLSISLIQPFVKSKMAATKKNYFTVSHDTSHYINLSQLEMCEIKIIWVYKSIGCALLLYFCQKQDGCHLHSTDLSYKGICQTIACIILFVS